MRVHKKIGTKERLFEMFENVNNIKINESFDSPIKKDKKYLDKTVGDQTSQVSKYDDGTRYPVEDKLKVKDPSLEKLKGDDAPIVEAFENPEDIADPDASNFDVEIDNPKPTIDQDYEDNLRYNRKYGTSRPTKDLHFPVSMEENSGDDFTAQAQLTTSNFGGMEIELDDSGDGLRYRWNQSGKPDEAVEAEIEYDTDGEPYFKTAEGESYFLSDFMRVNYPQIGEAEEIGVEDDQDVADEDEPINVDNDDTAEENPAWDENFGGDPESEETEVEDPEMSIDDIPAGDGEEAPELDNEIEDDGVHIDLKTSDGEEIETNTEEVEDGYTDQIEGGLADDAQPTDFCPIQIAKGIQIEMEHTDDPHKALEISMDHLTEIPDYYDRLEAMEAEAKGEGMESDMGAPEDSLLDPSKHWVDDYSAQNVSMGDDIEEDYPLEGGDPEAGEEEFEFGEKAKSGEFNDEEDK